jgi:hypothetical protein
MSATIGKDSNTGMTTITFDSTGRMVQFTKGESDDFDLRMLIVKAEGGLAKESIGQKALIALQRLGEAIVKGDPEEIASTWLGDGSKIVSEAIINGMVTICSKPENPFSLFLSSDTLDMVVDITEVVTAIIDELAQNIIDLEMTSEYDNLLPLAADRIKSLYHTGVGLSDTASREAMGEYFKDKFSEVFDVDEHLEMMTNDFMNHL